MYTCVCVCLCIFFFGFISHLGHHSALNAIQEVLISLSMLLVLNLRRNRANVCEERLPINTKARVSVQDSFQSLKMTRHCISESPTAKWLG